jgi:hypothetical protein
MSNDAPNSILGVAVAMAIVVVAFVYLQSLGITVVKDDHDLPPVVSPR